MRFLLLCAAAFLLLVAPTKTAPDESTTTDSPITTEPTDSDKGKSINSEDEEKLQAELADAKARLNVLEDDKKKLEAKLKSQTSKLKQNKKEAARDLEGTKKELQETLGKIGKYEFVLKEIQKTITNRSFKKLFKPSRKP
nr:uncharacterized protein LOC108074234 [Drosophila kikkawai]